jgi:hypothetical protein
MNNPKEEIRKKVKKKRKKTGKRGGGGGGGGVDLIITKLRAALWLKTVHTKSITS